MKEIDFINAKINKQNVSVPQFLYKYRPFDEHTFDMLENEYVYLCPAKNLDDPSECKVDFSIQDFYDLKSNRMTMRGLDMILDLVKPHTPEENFQRVRSIVYNAFTVNGQCIESDLLEAYFGIQELMPEEALVPLINQLRNVSEKLNEPSIRRNFEQLVSLANNARNGMGVCSLSQLRNFDEMWRNYANEEKGYCIEYDMTGYENLYALYPVVYQDNRETNIITNILGSFIGEMIFGMSGGQIVADKSQFIRMFLTKDFKWQYQKEWRLLGDANQRLSAPSINAIYLGKNLSEQNKQQMIDYCKMHNIIYF